MFLPALLLLLQAASNTELGYVMSLPKDFVAIPAEVFGGAGRRRVLGWRGVPIIPRRILSLRPAHACDIGAGASQVDGPACEIPAAHGEMERPCHRRDRHRHRPD